MTKEQCTALIKTIEQTAIFLLNNGVLVRNSVSGTVINPEYVSGLVDAYSGEIEDIISDIPDDPAPDDGNNDGEQT